MASVGSLEAPGRPGSSGGLAAIDEGVVAQYLLNKRYFLAALELHQELLEGNNGIHNISSLNAFFNNADTLASLVRSTEDKAKQNKASGQ